MIRKIEMNHSENGYYPQNFTRFQIKYYREHYWVSLMPFLQHITYGNCKMRYSIENLSNTVYSSKTIDVDKIWLILLPLFIESEYQWQI